MLAPGILVETDRYLDDHNLVGDCIQNYNVQFASKIDSNSLLVYMYDRKRALLIEIADGLSKEHWKHFPCKA